MVLEYKGAPVFYSDTGNGAAVVLLHGFLENSNIWNVFIPTISQSNRVICIDLLGHGKTGCLGYIHTMEDMADAVNTVLNYLKIKKFYVFGHSMGGYVALALAEKHQNSIEGLCLVNSTSRADTMKKKLNRDRAIKAVKENPKTFIHLAITNLFSSKNRNTFSKEIEAIKQEALKTPLQGIIAALEGMKIRNNNTSKFRNYTFKKMIILGKEDPVLDCNTIIEETCNTNIEIAVFPDGHMSYIENKEELLHKIMYFIE